MPLISSSLASELESIFASMPKDASMAANKMAMAYDNYCKAGLAGGIPPMFTGLEVKKLEGTLLGAISSPVTGTPATIATAWSTGIQAYWLSPPVVFTAPPIAGVTTAMPGAGVIVAGLTAVFLNLANTPAMTGKAMAAILDTATKTVLVTFATPPAPAGPPPPATVM